MTRIYISEDESGYAAEILDNKFIDNDIDEGGRIIINDEDIERVEKLLYGAGIEFEII